MSRPATTDVGLPNNARSSASSSIPAGSGHFNPAACARRSYSPTVLRAIWQLLATLRALSFASYRSRRTSRIFRMDYAELLIMRNESAEAFCRVDSGSVNSA